MRVGIIGGGWAGLAAAVELTAKKIPLTVFEAAREPGGRARKIHYNNLDLDNGQHILLGAYGETLRLMALCGVDDNALLRLPLQWFFHPGFFIHKAGLAAKLPAPLDLLGAFLKAKGMTLKQKFSVLRFMSVMRLRNFELMQDTTVAALLDEHNQTGALRDCLWEPLCVSALNTPIKIASAQVFLNVLRDGLFGKKTCSDLLVPQKNLGDIFPRPAASYIFHHGGDIRAGVSVSAIRPLESGFIVATRDDEQIFTHIICAAGPHQVAYLIETIPAMQPLLHLIDALEYEPIVTVYIQYNQIITIDHAMTGFYGGVVQWIFDREKLSGHKGLLAAVISASGAHREWNGDELALTVIEEIARAFPRLGAPLWHKVITEKRASFSCRPDVKRPPNSTPLKNFYLAGDYTQSDYPGTLEGAVRSGVRCAQLILDSATH
ncbi:MAG: hydroxysqualene dehydroxylase HpnE [Burkholderiales bacterium]